MKKISHSKTWTEIVFASSNSAESQAIRRALNAGKLRKIAPRLYSSNLSETFAIVVRRNAYHILGQLFPGAVIGYRSALEGGIAADGNIVLVYKYNKNVTLPGLHIHLVKGSPHQPNDMPFMTNLFIASRPRALLENLRINRSKDNFKKTVSHIEIENLLDKYCRVHGENELNLLRDQARQIAKNLNLEKEWSLLNKIISAILGSRPTTILQSKPALARAQGQGQPYDVLRLELFAKLVSYIKKEIIPIRISNNNAPSYLQNIAFFEAYFSNYIEGTEFAVEEAADIIFRHKAMPNRPEDAHDIIATYQIVYDIKEMQIIPTSANDLIEILKRRHYKLMDIRKDKQPGQFKSMANHAGLTIFVQPELVIGTLKQAYQLYETLDIGIERALFIMFVITEIHPFIDGSGRMARIMMNAELVHANQSRIIIPTVFRDDYMLALRQLSRSYDADAYIKMLLYAQDFSKTIDFSDFQLALQQLTLSNSFMDSREGRLKF